MPYFERSQSQHYESDCPHPLLQPALPPLYGSITCTHFGEKCRIVKLKLPYLCKKEKEKMCMVEEPSHVKQLSLSHVGKIGLIQ
jgi:hypothetical protein